MIFEDFERVNKIDEMYLIEAKIREEQEYWEWECEQKQQQLPAIIEIIHLPKLKLNETNNISTSL